MVLKTSLQSQSLHDYSVLVPALIVPSQIVVDFYSGVLFFADNGLPAIMSVRYDGSRLKTVLGPEHIHAVQSLAVFEDNIFYCETGLQTVYWVNKFGHSRPQQLQMLSSNVLTIIHPSLQPLQDPYDNTCK